MPLLAPCDCIQRSFLVCSTIAEHCAQWALAVKGTSQQCFPEAGVHQSSRWKGEEQLEQQGVTELSLNGHQNLRSPALTEYFSGYRRKEHTIIYTADIVHCPGVNIELSFLNHTVTTHVNAHRWTLSNL